jgi:hypothetical protein
MATAGPNAPGTCANVTALYGQGSWANWDNAKTSNNQYATVTVPSGAGPYGSDYLYISNLGFALGSSDIVTNILITIEGYAQYADSYNGTYNGTPYYTLDGVLFSYAMPNVVIPIVEGTVNSSQSCSLLGSNVNSANFGIGLRVYGRTALTSDYHVDQITVTLTYSPVVDKTFTADTIAAVTETFTKESTSFAYNVANNNIAYVYNLDTKGWTKITNCPFYNIIYRPSLKQLWGARRDIGQIAKVDFGSTFDGTAIDSVIKTGYMDFGEFDEIKKMEDIMANAIKRLRAIYSEVKSEGSLTLIIRTENDNTGKTFTITPTTTDNVVYNMVRTALSADIHGKFTQFKISNSSGQDFFIGKMALRISPKALA